MKKRFILLGLLLPVLAYGQFQPVKEKIVAEKNFFLVTRLAHFARKEPRFNDRFEKLFAPQLARIDQAIAANFDNGKENLLLFRVSDAALRDAGVALLDWFQKDKGFRKFVTDSVLNSGKYPVRSGSDSFLQNAWMTDVAGINHAIDVYGLGKAPNYPAIDSISFDVRLKSYSFFLSQTEAMVAAELKHKQSYFDQILTMALRLLELNGRLEAADFEPLRSGANKAAADFIKTVHWKQYPYSFILVPGAGTENYLDSINPMGIIRCRLAMEYFLQHKAPLLIVSGGRVHPYKTRHTEALVMKNYLINVLGVPEKNILIEPQARHTTTNIRNANRLARQYGIPLSKTAAIVTDRSQSRYITNKGFDNRCMKDLGYLPYVMGKRVNPVLIEYTPTANSSLINAMEPSDP